MDFHDGAVVTWCGCRAKQKQKHDGMRRLSMGDAMDPRLESA